MHELVTRTDLALALDDLKMSLTIRLGSMKDQPSQNSHTRSFKPTMMRAPVVSAANFYVDAYFLKVLPEALLLHPADLSFLVLR